MVNNYLADAEDANPGYEIRETGAGNGICTLRAAVMEANASTGLDEIFLPANTFTLTQVGYDDTGENSDLIYFVDVQPQGVSLTDTINDGNGATL